MFVFQILEMEKKVGNCSNFLEIIITRPINSWIYYGVSALAGDLENGSS